MSRSKGSRVVEELALPEFVARCDRGQAEAAEKLGCTQGNISQALKDIAAGLKTVRVRVLRSGEVEADIIKPFGRQGQSTQ